MKSDATKKSPQRLTKAYNVTKAQTRYPKKGRKGKPENQGTK